MFKICMHQLRHALVSPKFYTAILIGVVVQLITSVPLYDYAETIGEPLCIVDGFLFSNSDFFSVAAASLGIILLVADIPFTSQNETYTLMRVSRRRWICGKLLYLFCVCGIYYFIMFLASAVYFAENAYISNVWSQPLYILTQDNAGQYLAEYGIYYRYPYLLSEYTPFTAFLISLTLSVCYAFVLSQFVFWLNLKLSTSMGYFIAIMYHFLNYFMVAIIPTAVLQKFSLLAYTSLNYHFYNDVENTKNLLTIPQSFAVLFFISILLSVFVSRAVKRYDFKITVGTKQ